MDKKVIFKSLDALVPVKNIIEEAQMALQVEDRTIATSSIPEVLKGVTEMGVGAVGITSGLTLTSGILLGLVAGVGTLLAPVSILGIAGYGIFAHVKYKDLLQAKESLLKRAVILRDGIIQLIRRDGNIQQLKSESNDNKERMDYLSNLNILLEVAINDLKSDLGKESTIVSEPTSHPNNEEPNLLFKAAEYTWKYVRDTPEIAVEKYNKMDKGYKILAIAAMAGGAVISIPFIVAAASGVSIVSALATLGFGALAAGGYGVAGGIIVTSAGSALAAALAGAVASKVIDDPEVNELIENYSKLEEIIKQNFVTMDNHQTKYKHLYKKYAATAIYVAKLNDQIQNGQKYDINEVKDINNRIKYTIEDIQKELESEAV